ncbi:MAG TPA: hypothetical protein VEC93_11495 [Anaerolineae bacterium]|nr:hypothetical protein [Anaerolineae bacterium]
MGWPASALVGHLVSLAAATLIKPGLVEGGCAGRVVGAQGEEKQVLPARLVESKRAGAGVGLGEPGVSERGGRGQQGQL